MSGPKKSVRRVVPRPRTLLLLSKIMVCGTSEILRAAIKFGWHYIQLISDPVPNYTLLQYNELYIILELIVTILLVFFRVPLKLTTFIYLEIKVVLNLIKYFVISQIAVSLKTYINSQI